MSNVADARNFAKKKHAGQLRKNGKTTTFSHLKDVVKNLKKMKVTDKDTICAAWLHDTIEDTDTDFDSIKDRFGKNVADILANVNDAPNAGRNTQWEKQQFVKKSKYWSYVSSVKPGKLAELSWANNEWKKLQEKYS